MEVDTECCVSGPVLNIMVNMEDKTPFAQIEEAVKKCEDSSNVEVVVVFSKRSGPYRDVHFLCGAFLALLTALFLVFSSQQFSDLYLAPNLIIMFFLGYALPWFFPSLYLWLTSRERRTKQVQAAAELAFFRQGVSLTRSRTGLLLFLSLQEGDGALLGDVGVRKAIPGDLMGKLTLKLRESARAKDPVEATLSFLADLCEPLSKFVPFNENNPNELPNRPVWLEGNETWP